MSHAPPPEPLHRVAAEFPEAVVLASPSQPGGNPAAWLTAYCLLAAVLVLVSAGLPCDEIEWWSCQAMFAVVLTESLLAAVWLVLGPGRLGVRLVLAPLGVVVTAALAGVFDRPSDAFGILLAIAVTMHGVCSALLLGLRYGLRIELARDDELAPGGAFQFRIIHLAALTLAISLLLGLGRWLVELQVLRHLRGELPLSLLIGLVWTLSLLPAVFIPCWRVNWRRVAGGSGLGLLLTIAAATVGSLLIEQFDHIGTGRFPSVLVTIPVLAYGLTFGCLLLLRAAGYRLAIRGAAEG